MPPSQNMCKQCAILTQSWRNVGSTSITLTHGYTLLQRLAMFVHGDSDKTGLTRQFTVMVTQQTDTIDRSDTIDRW